VEREEEQSVICINVAVKRKGKDQSAERGNVHDEEYRALRNTTSGNMKGREVVITLNTEGAR